MRSALPARLRAATTCVTATEATRMLGLRPRFVDGEASPAELIGVQLGDGFLRLLVRAHFHEREPARAPRGHIAHHCNRFDGSRPREQLLELCFSRFVGEVSDIQLPTHETDSSVADATIGTVSRCTRPNHPKQMRGWISSRA